MWSSRKSHFQGGVVEEAIEGVVNLFGVRNPNPDSSTQSHEPPRLSDTATRFTFVVKG